MAFFFFFGKILYGYFSWSTISNFDYVQNFGRKIQALFILFWIVRVDEIKPYKNTLIEKLAVPKSRGLSRSFEEMQGHVLPLSLIRY